jgi:hypothetical protein
MNPLLSSQTNRESFAAMIAWGDEKNTNSFYEPPLILQNTPQNGGEKEAGKIGAEFPRTPFPPRLHFGAGLWEKTGEMILQATMDSVRNHWSKF